MDRALESMVSVLSSALDWKHHEGRDRIWWIFMAPKLRVSHTMVCMFVYMSQTCIPVASLIVRTAQLTSSCLVPLANAGSLNPHFPKCILGNTDPIRCCFWRLNKQQK